MGLVKNLYSRQRAVYAYSLIALLLVSPEGLEAKSISPKPALIEKTHLECREGKDHMSVLLKLKIKSLAQTEIPLFTRSGLLKSSDKPSKYTQLVQRGLCTFLKVDRAGTHEVQIKIVFPLRSKKHDSKKSFSLNLPLALSTEVDAYLLKGDMSVSLPETVSFKSQEEDSKTHVKVFLEPGKNLSMSWMPRSRETRKENKIYFADIYNLYHLNEGLVEGWHEVNLRISQGEIETLHLDIPADSTVTSLAGENIGGWSFDPVKHQVEVRYTKARTDHSQILFRTQKTGLNLPYQVSLSSPFLAGAKRQKSIGALVPVHSILIKSIKNQRRLDVDDFRRVAKNIISKWGGRPSQISSAFRIEKGELGVLVKTERINPEIRTHEKASFSISEDRLIYNSDILLKIQKAGIFSCTLDIPKSYDLDSLSSKNLSHWDEEEEGELKKIHIHFKTRALGEVGLKLSMSHPLVEFKDTQELPSIHFESSLKHSGKVFASSSRGIRLDTLKRKGFSEITSQQAHDLSQGIFAYKILGMDRQLILETKIIHPRINVNFLHTARVQDGLVRHVHQLRYDIRGTGVKEFNIQVPKNIVGLDIRGPSISQSSLVDPEKGIWRIELEKKWFGRPYPLRVMYDKVYGAGQKNVELLPILSEGSQWQKGYLVVFCHERIELLKKSNSGMMREADSRNIPSTFSAEDYSDALFCYRTSTRNYRLDFSIKRHETAQVPEAKILSGLLETCIGEGGDLLNQFTLSMEVSNKPHLEVLLPEHSQLWSLQVGGQFVTPSEKKGALSKNILFIPLPRSTTGKINTKVQFKYSTALQDNSFPREHNYIGPELDLPVQNLVWRFYLPEGYTYNNFGGTMDPIKNGPLHLLFNRLSYDQENQKLLMAHVKNARRLQKMGSHLAEKGRQLEARQALELACQQSTGDIALNEDTRVQLHQLIRQQAIVGLVQRRNQLRPSNREKYNSKDFGVQFNQSQASRLRNSLDKKDSLNLESIVNRMIEIQDESSAPITQMILNPPKRGRVLEFKRGLQVEAKSLWSVSFSSQSQKIQSTEKWLWGFGMTLGIILLSTLLGLKRKPKMRILIEG